MNRPQEYLTDRGVRIFADLEKRYPEVDTYQLSILAHSYDQYHYFSELLETEKVNPKMKVIELQRIAGMANTFYKQALASAKTLSKGKPEEELEEELSSFEKF